MTTDLKTFEVSVNSGGMNPRIVRVEAHLYQIEKGNLKFIMMVENEKGDGLNYEFTHTFANGAWQEVKLVQP